MWQIKLAAPAVTAAGLREIRSLAPYGRIDTPHGPPLGREDLAAIAAIENLVELRIGQASESTRDDMRELSVAKSLGR